MTEVIAAHEVCPLLSIEGLEDKWELVGLARDGAREESFPAIFETKNLKPATSYDKLSLDVAALAANMTNAQMFRLILITFEITRQGLLC